MTDRFSGGIGMPTNKLTGKVIVITGASSGVGKALAYQCAEHGAIPVLIARRKELLEYISNDIYEKYSMESCLFALDISDSEEVIQTFNTIYEKFGTVDVLINNAGFGIFDSVVAADMTDVKRMFDVNVIGLVSCTKSVLNRMLNQNKGHIINVASQAGKVATPKSSAYSATKHAVLGFTNSLRMEVAKTNINVTAVNPGPIQTTFFDIADKEGTYLESVKRYIVTPEKVARDIIRIISKPKRELNIPRWMNIGSIIYQLFPTLLEKIAGGFFNKK